MRNSAQSNLVKKAGSESKPSRYATGTSPRQAFSTRSAWTKRLVRGSRNDTSHRRSELYQWPGVAKTVRFDHIVRHYHFSHESINPHRIIPINPVLDWDAPHGREELERPRLRAAGN